MSEQTGKVAEIEVQCRLVRMEACDDEDAVMGVREIQRPRPRVRIGPNRQDPRHPGGARPLDRLGWIVERVEVRVRVDHAASSRRSSSSTIPGSSFLNSGSGARSF